MIVKAVDEGMMSYRVAKTQAEKYGRVGPIEKVLPAVTACKLTTDATKMPGIRNVVISAEDVVSAVIPHLVPVPRP